MLVPDLRADVYTPVYACVSALTFTRAHERRVLIATSTATACGRSSRSSWAHASSLLTLQGRHLGSSSAGRVRLGPRKGPSGERAVQGPKIIKPVRLASCPLSWWQVSLEPQQGQRGGACAAPSRLWDLRALERLFLSLAPMSDGRCTCKHECLKRTLHTRSFNPDFCVCHFANQFSRICFLCSRGREIRSARER